MGIHLTPGRNVLGGALRACSYDPVTGYFRDGCCRTRGDDEGQHVVCARMTDEFLDYAQSQGNDLFTPRPEWRFAGLKAGQRWCLCAARWLQACHDGVAPPVILESTHENALDVIPLALLMAYAWQPLKPAGQA